MASYDFSVNGEGAAVVSFPTLLAVGALAAVSTRLGGVSEGPYRSLNLSRGVGDDPARVSENRRRFLAGLGLGGRRLVVGEQVHGDGVAEATASGPAVFPQTDALFTRDPRVVVAIAVADCVPVFVVAPDIRAVGAAHAGWRGTVRGVVSRLVERLVALGQDPRRLQAAIGPAAGGECYEVGDDVLDALLTAHPWARAHVRGRLLDLAQVNRELLVRAGVPAGQIACSGLCTICHPGLFFSYRRDGRVSGRMLGCIARYEEGTAAWMANVSGGCAG